MAILSDGSKAEKGIGDDTISGIIICIFVILSLIAANSPLSGPLAKLLALTFGYQSDLLDLKYSLLQWVNDGLMAIFFLLIGLDIKREMVQGELSSLRKALLPIFCAIGGALIPAIIFMAFNNGRVTESGWGIPMATDIAFALAVISLLKGFVPAGLKPFLSTLAVVDDLIAILVIALFYSQGLHVAYLLYAAGIVAVLFILNRMKVQGLIFYIVPGVFLWYFIHHSGIHATIAGVVTAMFVPIEKKGGASPLEKLEHFLKRPVNFFIVPLFAFCNTTIRFESGMTEGLVSRLGLGIMIGLLVGKPLGVLAISFIGTKARIFTLPTKVGWRHMLGVGLLAGIGFTMSIFIALLSFEDGSLIAISKFSILGGSLVCGVLGYVILRWKKGSKQTVGD